MVLLTGQRGRQCGVSCDCRAEEEDMTLCIITCCCSHEVTLFLVAVLWMNYSLCLLYALRMMLSFVVLLSGIFRRKKAGIAIGLGVGENARGRRGPVLRCCGVMALFRTLKGWNVETFPVQSVAKAYQCIENTGS